MLTTIKNHSDTAKINAEYYKKQFKKYGKAVFIELARMETEQKRECDRLINKMESKISRLR